MVELGHVSLWCKTPVVGACQFVISVTPFSRIAGGCWSRRDMRDVGVMEDCVIVLMGSSFASMLLMIAFVSFILSNKVVY